MGLCLQNTQHLLLDRYLNKAAMVGHKLKWHKNINYMMNFYTTIYHMIDIERGENKKLSINIEQTKVILYKIDNDNDKRFLR